MTASVCAGASCVIGGAEACVGTVTAVRDLAGGERAVDVETAWGTVVAPLTDAEAVAPAAGDAFTVAATGPLAGVVRRGGGPRIAVSGDWGSAEADAAAVAAAGFGPPGACVAWTVAGGGAATGVLLGWRPETGHRVLCGGEEADVDASRIEARTPCASGLSVRTSFGDGVAASADAFAAVVALDWGATLRAPHASGAVRCPAALAAPVARCVRGVALELIERARARAESRFFWGHLRMLVPPSLRTRGTAVSEGTGRFEGSP